MQLLITPIPRAWLYREDVDLQHRFLRLGDAVSYARWRGAAYRNCQILVYPRGEGPPRLVHPRDLLAS